MSKGKSVGLIKNILETLLKSLDEEPNITTKRDYIDEEEKEETSNIIAWTNKKKNYNLNIDNMPSTWGYIINSLTIGSDGSEILKQFFIKNVSQHKKNEDYIIFDIMAVKYENNEKLMEFKEDFSRIGTGLYNKLNNNISLTYNKIKTKNNIYTYNITNHYKFYKNGWLSDEINDMNALTKILSENVNFTIEMLPIVARNSSYTTDIVYTSHIYQFDLLYNKKNIKTLETFFGENITQLNNYKNSFIDETFFYTDK
jgi:hypothetical protein